MTKSNSKKKEHQLPEWVGELPEKIELYSESWCEPVFIDGVEIDIKKSLAVRNHAPSGFAWGYSGSGPSQLALAILMHFLPANIAESIYMRFKVAAIATLPQVNPLKQSISLRETIKNILTTETI
jgi:hypothetical protein